MKAFKNSNAFGDNSGSGGGSGAGGFMARAAVQTPAFRDIKAVIINSSLVKESNISSRVIKAIRSS